jgi:hypothetical protein
MAKGKPTKARRTRRRRQPERELPRAGTELVARYRGKEVAARIVVDEQRGGDLAVECRGTRYRSLSSAARAITGNSVNGWRFWQSQDAGRPKAKAS